MSSHSYPSQGQDSSNVGVSGLRGPYVPAVGTLDEMMFPDGTVRPHWRTFASFLEQCSAADLQARQEGVQRLLRDHGVTYNVFDDALGTSRPWMLDTLPFLVSAEEFHGVTAGLSQRVRLLEAIIQDLYGPQRLLRESLIPAQLVYSNPGFLRPVCGATPPGERFLLLYAADLVRDRTGAWMALADRAQSPSAHGYTLENRAILSQIFQEEFHTSHVRRLNDYFDLMRDSLRCLSPQGRRGGAGILMLTPGPKHETYFEHAYKARYLGFPLVEGADLTVRDRRLWLKTLEGLKRVDVLLRHIDDIDSDPLELKPDASLGIPGLTEAWRSGSVTLANGLGSGVVETPALHSFLPNLCRTLLGEDLLLASVPTLWCGTHTELQRVLDHPAQWVLKPAFARGARDPIFLNQLSRADLTAMLSRLRAAPQDWVAQELLPLSTTPTFTQGKIQPRPLVWRALGLADGPDGSVFLPGGLTRVSPAAGQWVVTMRSGGISKDTWIVSSEPEAPVQPAPAPPTVFRTARPPSAVPSRAADHLFWLGRYAERLEQTVRAFRAALHRISGEPSEVQNQEGQACLALLSATGHLPAATTRLLDHLPALMRDPRLPGSLPDLLARIRFNAASARDRLSDDTWRLIHRMDRDARLPADAFHPSAALTTLDTLILDLAAYSGMHLENVTRGHGWRFLEIGRRIERASTACELLKAASTLALSDNSVLPPLLEIFDSTMTYRRFHFARPALAPLLGLLLLEGTNPRSVAFQTSQLDQLARNLPTDRSAESAGAERALIDDLQSHLLAFPLSQMASEPQMLHINTQALCTRLIAGLESVSDTITEHYFSHATRRVR